MSENKKKKLKLHKLLYVENKIVYNIPMTKTCHRYIFFEFFVKYISTGGDSMRITITGRNIELTSGIKEAVEDKLSKLEKYFKPDTDVLVTLSVEKDRQKIEVTIPTKGHTIRAEEVSNDMYVSIDLVEETIERQLIKYRTKIVSKKLNAAANFKAEYLEEQFDEDEEEVKIVRSKRYDLKPMYPEDACIQMELLGHDFFVFVNAENDAVCVVYKRKGNTYGIIEPE